MMDLCSEQDLTVANTGQTSRTASFVDATGDGLNLSFTLPRELKSKGTMRMILAFPARKSLRALAGVQGIRAVPSRLRT